MSEMSAVGQAQSTRGRLEAWALYVPLTATVVLAVVWSVMWLPVYTANYQAQLFLFPVFLFAAAVIGLAAGGGAVIAVISLIRHGASARGIWGLIVGAIVMIISLPIMFFGLPFIATY